MSGRRRHLAALATLALLGGCVKKEACRPGTILLTLTFDAAAKALTSLDVTTTVDGRAKTDTIPHDSAKARMTVEITLSPYTERSSFKVAVSGDMDSAHFEAETPSTMLQAGCSTLTLALAAPPDGGAGDAPTDSVAIRGDAIGGGDDGPRADVACGNNAHACAGGTTCFDNADPKTCGTRCAPCPVPLDADHATCDGVTCGFKCATGHHRCGDLCADDTSAETCGGSCVACVPPTGGTATCDGTTCGGACPPGDKLCAGVCIAATDTCTGFCAVATHDCNGLCASNTSINTCGPSACTACPTPMNGTASCDGNTCVAKCDDGYKPCPDATCVPIGGCCTGSDCGTPPNGIGICAANHSCNLACKSGFHLCGGQCVDDMLPAHCGMSCDACPTPMGGTATCDGQSCGGDCPDGKQLCAGACIPTSQLCNDMCAPGTHDCSGQCLANASVGSCGLRCDACPVPENGASTCNGVTCDFACGSGFKRCGTICIASSSCCVTDDCPTIGNGTAVCSANHLCGFSCASGYHACNGGCANDHSPASCGTSCSGCSTPQGGAATCDGTTCGASCPGDQKLCANACIASGASCMGTCPAGTHDCGGLCLSDTSVNSCGASCAACPAVANATPTCASGACGFQCDAGFQLCAGACIDSSLCCDDTDCPGGACMSGKCCAAGQMNCGGACIDPTTNANNCGGCGKPCAGRCSAGLCCGANQNACGGTCYNTNTDASHCGPGCAKCALDLLCVNGKCVL